MTVSVFVIVRGLYTRLYSLSTLFFTPSKIIFLTPRKPHATVLHMEYVTITKAAELLGVSRPTVYKMIANGLIKTRQFVGRPAIAMSEITKRNGTNHHPSSRRRESK